MVQRLPSGDPVYRCSKRWGGWGPGKRGSRDPSPSPLTARHRPPVSPRCLAVEDKVSLLTSLYGPSHNPEPVVGGSSRSGRCGVASTYPMKPMLPSYVPYSTASLHTHPPCSPAQLHQQHPPFAARTPLYVATLLDCCATPRPTAPLSPTRLLRPHATLHQQQHASRFPPTRLTAHLARS